MVLSSCLAFRINSNREVTSTLLYPIQCSVRLGLSEYGRLVPTLVSSSAEDCTIAVNTSAAVPISVESFTTEAGYDNLLVNCKAYSGLVGPEGVVPDTTIYWYADGSVVASGWKICPSSDQENDQAKP